MVTLLDRLLIYSYLKAYLICLVSLLGLYVVVDLFMNIDDFAQQKGLGAALQHIAIYYGMQITVIFDRLCEVIALLAAMFTVALVQRNNELVPLLSAGVSTQRVVRPVLFSACLMLGLSVLNQELLIPSLGSAVMFARDDPNGERDTAVSRNYEPNGVLLTGGAASRRDLLVKDFSCSIPESIGPGEGVFLEAKEARYVPRDPDRPTRTGGWMLTDTRPADLPKWTNTQVLDPVAPGKYFLYTEVVDFDTITRDRKWFFRAPTWQVYEELGRVESNRLAAMAVLFHMRLTRPILGMILVFLGLSVILRDQNRNVFISAGLCLGLCALFFAAGLGCKYLGEKEFLSPALAAWLPVLFFGPLAFVLFDSIHT